MSVVDVSNSSLTPLEELPRATQSNPLGFDELTLARREREIANITKDYPTVPPKFIETAWDFVATSKSEEEALEYFRSAADPSRLLDCAAALCDEDGGCGVDVERGSMLLWDPCLREEAAEWHYFMHYSARCQDFIGVHVWRREVLATRDGENCTTIEHPHATCDAACRVIR